jgi:hypothetical protein
MRESDTLRELAPFAPGVLANFMHGESMVDRLRQA